MSTPYRRQDTIPDKPMSVCAWCKHLVRDHGGPGCDEGVRLDPLDGRVRVLKSPHKKNSNGECLDYAPTLLTRISPWRRR